MNTDTSRGLPPNRPVPNPGDKLRFVRLRSPISRNWKKDSKNAAFLKPYKIYTVKSTYVGISGDITVWLAEFPDDDIRFNLEQFDDVKPLNIVNWFNPHSIRHIKAYKHVLDTGCWPEGFIPEDPVFPVLWRISIVNKLADCWIEHKVGK